ncbi:uncharacterized protein LOC142570958 [Dermacentor variabilis]|uniref:uncharacterized protein LOC142570958 n=1 Tax=Dermacentor variabilis TaxID=34621 RepID=UPI003F5B9AF7
MATSQSLEQQQQLQHSNQTGSTADRAHRAHKGEDKGYRISTGKGVCNFSAERSATVLVFYVTPPSITGFPGLPFPSCLRRRFVDESGSFFCTVYCPELGDCTNSASKANQLRATTTSASSCARSMLDSGCSPRRSELSARETGEFSTDETHAGCDNGNIDALLRAEDAKKHCNALLDPLVVEHGLWEDLQGAHRRRTVAAYGAVSVKRSPTAHAISVGRAVEVVNFYNH